MSSDHERESNRKVHIEQTATQFAQANTQREQDKTRTEQAATGAHQAATQIEQDNTWTTEQALRASELSYRRLFEAAQDGILILEVDTGRITDVNPFLVKLLGFSHAEMIGKTGSHGCFRLTNWDAIWLATVVRLGTPVRIVKRTAEASWGGG